MVTPSADEPTDQDRLLFGAGFVFGVMATLVILAVMLVGVTGDRIGGAGVTAVPVLASVAGGVVFTAIVGTGLYLLAFPANREGIPVDLVLFGLDDGGEE